MTSAAERSALIETIGTIYDASLEPERWGEALRLVVESVGGERGALALTSGAASRSELPVTHDLDPELLLRWVRDYEGFDPWAGAVEAGGGMEVGNIIHVAAFRPPEELRAMRVYQELMKPGGLGDAITAILAIEDGIARHVAVYRSEESGLFDRRQVSALAVLAPHLIRAARIQSSLAGLERRVEITEAVLDRLDASVMVVNERGDVEFTNRAAEGLLGEGDGLALRDQRLHCDDAGTGRLLRRQLGHSLASAAGESAAGGSVLALSRPSGRRTLSAIVSPLAARVGQALGFWRQPSPAALVLVTDPDRKDDSPEPVLRELFGLTAAEARAAWALASGRKLDDYAEEAGIAVTTARWQIKQVQAKTGTRRQAELVSLVLRSLGPLRPAGG